MMRTTREVLAPAASTKARTQHQHRAIYAIRAGRGVLAILSKVAQWATPQARGHVPSSAHACVQRCASTRRPLSRRRRRAERCRCETSSMRIHHSSREECLATSSVGQREPGGRRRVAPATRAEPRYRPVPRAFRQLAGGNCFQHEASTLSVGSPCLKADGRSHAAVGERIGCALQWRSATAHPRAPALHASSRDLQHPRRWAPYDPELNM